jgi:predicted PurR-regulated permease PerM
MNIQNKQPVVVSVSTTTFLKVIAVLLMLGFAWLVRDVLFLLLIAIVLAAAFDPWVDWFQKKKIPRAISILGIYLLLVGIFSLAIGLMVPVVVEQTNELLKNLPDYVNQFTHWLTNIQATAVEFGVFEEMKSSFASWQASLGQSTGGGVLTLVGGVFGGLISLFSVLVMTFYMIIEEDNTKKFIMSISPKKYQEYLIQLMDRISLRMGQWLRGQLILSFSVGFLVYIGLSIFGVKYAFVLALIAAITEIIPYVGPILGAVPGVLIGFTISPWMGISTILLYFIIQQVENSFLTPKIMSKAVGLNPVIVIISILVGAKVGGPIGAIISIPVAIILSIFLKDFMDYPWQYKGTEDPNIS